METSLLMKGIIDLVQPKLTFFCNNLNNNKNLIKYSHYLIYLDLTFSYKLESFQK